MKFPDPNVGYVFGYGSKVTGEGILVTFLGGAVRIWFKYLNIERVNREVYRGGQVSWDVIRWGKCSSGTEALRVILRQGPFRNHLIVFDNLEKAVCDLKSQGIDMGS